MLIHVANVLYLLSYLVKDILWLRILTIVAGLILMVTFVEAHPPLWPAIGWNVVFTFINAYQIYLLILERRPVQLSEQEQRLYQLVFRSLTPREFLKLVRIATWEDAAEAQRVVEKGQALERVMVIAAGRAAVQIEGRAIAHLGEGQFVGEMSFLTDQHPAADVVAVAPTRFVVWPKARLRAFLAEHPPMRATIQLVIGTDLVAKLRAQG